MSHSVYTEMDDLPSNDTQLVKHDDLDYSQDCHVIDMKSILSEIEAVSMKEVHSQDLARKPRSADFQPFFHSSHIDDGFFMSMPESDSPKHTEIKAKTETVNPEVLATKSREEVSIPEHDTSMPNSLDDISSSYDEEESSDNSDSEEGTEEERLKTLIEKWTKGIEDLEKDTRKLQKTVKELKMEQSTLEYQLNSPHSDDGEESKEVRMDQFVTNYPSERVTIKNLVRAQLEYYLSYVNLKQDKRTLNELLAWPSGYLRLSSVMKLTRIRQLSISEDLLKEGLMESRVLDVREFEGHFTEPDSLTETKSSDSTSKLTTSAVSATSPGCDAIATASEGEELKCSLKEDDHSTLMDKSVTKEWCVGRMNFVPPEERLFPFRRTVFIYGVPSFDGDQQKSIEFVKEMLAPFGSFAEPKLDCEECDYLIGAQLLKKARVFEFFATEMPISETMTEKPPVYEFFTNADTLRQRLISDVHSVSDSTDGDHLWSLLVKETDNGKFFTCCSDDCKEKPIKEGVYFCLSDLTLPMLCPQCGARKAEENQIARWHELSSKQRTPALRETYLGRNPYFSKGAAQSRTCTARAVFTSQRQAAKCAFVRTRVAWKGAFATQLHHYAKVKKSVKAGALSASRDSLSESSFHGDGTTSPTQKSSKITVDGCGSSVSSVTSSADCPPKTAVSLCSKKSDSGKVSRPQSGGSRRSRNRNRKNSGNQRGRSRRSRGYGGRPSSHHSDHSAHHHSYAPHSYSQPDYAPQSYPYFQDHQQYPAFPGYGEYLASSQSGAYFGSSSADHRGIHYHHHSQQQQHYHHPRHASSDSSSADHSGYHPSYDRSAYDDHRGYGHRR